MVICLNAQFYPSRLLRMLIWSSLHSPVSRLSITQKLSACSLWSLQNSSCRGKSSAQPHACPQISKSKRVQHTLPFLVFPKLLTPHLVYCRVLQSLPTTLPSPCREICLFGAWPVVYLGSASRLSLLC